MEENIIKEIKAYENKDRFIVLNKDNIYNTLNDININCINLIEGNLIRGQSGVFKYSYTDYENPYVIEKGSFGNNVLNINPKYYLNNINECSNIINSLVTNTKSKEIDISKKVLLDDRLVNIICNNSNIENVVIEKYSDNPYILSVEHFKIFKKYNKKVDTKEVCEELKNNYDYIILCNSEKSLIGHYKYRDLVSKNEILINDNLEIEQYEYLKYINKNANIVFDIDNDYENIFKIINYIKGLNNNNTFTIEINDKELFNKFILEKDLDINNINVKTPTLDRVRLNEYLKFEKVLYEMIKPALNLSPFERYIYAYNITKQFKTYKEHEVDNKASRRLYDILVNEYMVCVGYKNLLGDLLNKLNIPNQDLSVSVDESYDRVDVSKIEFNESIIVNRNGHARVYVNLIDPKYNINGYYVSDPTWDNDLVNDYYNHMLMTDEESVMSSRYQWINNMDIFNIKDISEYYTKIKREFNNNDYRSFVIYIKSIIDSINKFDSNLYVFLNEKYNFIEKMPYNWPNDITSLVNDLGIYILNHVNKNISGETLFEGIREIYLNSYGYTEETVDEVLENVRINNKNMHNKCFPLRKRINSDGTEEIIMNEINKFDFIFNKNKEL